MSTPSGSGVSLSSISLLYSPMVTVRVGHNKQEFCIHKDILCSQSRYFAKALSGQFLEARTRVFEFEDVHPVLFKVFVAWSYTGNIAYNSSGSGASSYDDMEKLDTALREEYSYEQKERSDQSVSKDEDDDIDYFQDFEEEVPESWTYLILGALFVLGDRLDSASFKRKVLDTIVKRNEEISSKPDASAILCAYANTTKNCPLRRLLLHIVAYDARFDKSHDVWEHYPVEFLTAVMVTLGRRLPNEQCKSCFKEAVDSNKIRSKYIDDVYVKKDQPPYKRDLCFYHEHENAEEKNRCLAAREEENDSE